VWGLCPFTEHSEFSLQLGWFLSSDKISSLVLQSCHVYFTVPLIHFTSAHIILDLSCSLIAKVLNPGRFKIWNIIWIWTHHTNLWYSCMYVHPLKYHLNMNSSHKLMVQLHVCSPPEISSEYELITQTYGTVACMFTPWNPSSFEGITCGSLSGSE